MQPILEKIIDPVQSAFVPKRSIHDNILLTHEFMNKFKNMKGKNPGWHQNLIWKKLMTEWSGRSSLKPSSNWDFIQIGLLGLKNASLQCHILLLLMMKCVAFFFSN